MVTRIITSIAFLTFAIYINAQELPCGTVPTKKDIELLKNLDVKSGVRARSEVAEPIKIAITAHIVRRSNGTGGLTEQQLTDAILSVNSIYQLTNMEFFLFGDINYIDNDSYFDFNSSQEAELSSQHFVANTINVYFFNSATSGENPVCGYARFPQSGIDRIIMVNDCTTNGSTFPHELGHYFALYHTHGKTNTGTTDELVDGSNCSSAGDDVCDTSADPNLSGLVNGSCEYTGNGTDANGDAYIPNPRNLMSYSQKHCRDEFSQGQADRIAAAYQEFKTYIYDKNYAADFDLSVREICEGNSVDFLDKSVNAVSYAWTFEGGTPSNSSDPNPTINYQTSGVYDVSLTITEAGGDTHTKELESYILVKEEISSSITSKSGSFEEASIQETIINADESITWVKTSSASNDGSSSMMIDFYNYGNTGEEDYLVVAALNTVDEKSFVLSFDYAYSSYDNTYFDGLEIVYRDPCGEWQSIWFKEGTDLQTVAFQESFFAPSSSDWDTEAVVIEIPVEIDVAEIAFKSINGYGNALYIDNYLIDVFEDNFDIQEVTVSNSSCPDTNDGSIYVTVDGLGTYDFSIDGENFVESSEFISLLPGTYELTVRNAVGSIISQTVEVFADNDYPEIPVITSSNGGLTIATSDGQTVRWYFEGIAQENETLPTLTDPLRGSYTVEVSNGDCSSISDPFIVLAINEVDNQLKIFPNPVNDVLKLDLPVSLQKEIQSIEISDLSGRRILSTNEPENLIVSSLNSGIYLLRLKVDGQILTRRFLKQ